MTKSQKAYPTDLNDTEWNRIVPYLPAASLKGRPLKYPWRAILNAIFYVVKNGCVWRALPHDFPAWQTVYYYFALFRREGYWEQWNRMIREAVREKEGREAQPSAMIVDSQSAKSAECGEQRGYDGNKKIIGRKRNLVVDTLGLVVVAKVTPANVQDVHAGKQVLSDLAQEPTLISRLQKIFADGGYRGELVEWVSAELHAVLEIVLKVEGQKGFQVLPKRWVVERTFAWISRYRRLARDYEHLAATSEALIYIAMIRLGLRRLARS
jgi:putative transposase